MMPQYTYQPKGGMCANCKYKLFDCSTLPFDKMYVIERDDINNINIVRCEDFVRIENDK